MAADFSEKMLRRAEKKYGRFQNVTSERGSIQQMDYPGASFDAAVAAQIYGQKYPGKAGGMVLISIGGMDAETLKSLKRKPRLIQAGGSFSQASGRKAAEIRERSPIPRKLAFLSRHRKKQTKSA